MNCSRADTEPMKETIIEESEHATPKAIGWLWWDKFLWGQCHACCYYPSVSSGLLLEKPFKLGCFFGLFWSGKGVICFQQMGVRKAPLCHFQLAFMYAVTTPVHSFFRVGVSGVTQFLSGQLSFSILFLVFLISYKSFSVLLLVWL